MSACIVGWKHLKFGKHQGRDLESLIVEAAAGAIEDAGIAPADVDAIFIGTFNGGLVAQDFPASLVLQTSADLRFTPATRVENACATGSAAVYQGLAAIASGRARRALVVGVEKMTEVSGVLDPQSPSLMLRRRSSDPSFHTAWTLSGDRRRDTSISYFRVRHNLSFKLGRPRRVWT